MNPYLGLLPQSGSVYVVVLDPSPEKLKAIGFSDALADGETLLPCRVGIISRYNAEGKRIINTDKPMEIVTHTREWLHKEWHGKKQVEVSRLVDFHYRRRPRTILPPPSIELTLFTDERGRRVVSTPAITEWRNNHTLLIHSTNLMLELFGECSFYDGNRKDVLGAEVRRLNWMVLPHGEMPYSKLREQLIHALRNVRSNKKAFAEHRLERLNSYKPEFVAVGQGGFTGYVVFAYPDRELFILESILYGNATYTLGENWENLSKLTKAAILQNSLHKQRLIHNSKWFEHIHRLFE